MATNSLPAKAGVDRTAVLRKVRRTILPVAFLLYAFNYMDRSSISYAQLTMGKELGIDVATYGAIAAIFFIAYVVLEVPSNMILAKVGARLWLARIAITWGLVTIGTGFVSNVTQLYIARILLGIAEAGLFPGLILFLTYWFMNHDRGRAIGAMARQRDDRQDEEARLQAGTLSGEGLRVPLPSANDYGQPEPEQRVPDD